VCTLPSFLNKWQFLLFSSFVLILQWFFCSILFEAFKVLPVISYLWIYAYVERPIPSDKRGTCAQEAPSDSLEWSGKAYNLQTHLNRRVAETSFCYFIISYSLKQFVQLLFLFFILVWWGEGGGFWHCEKRLKTIGLIKDKYEGLLFG